VFVTNIDAAAQHRFNVEEGDWGFTRFCDLQKLTHRSGDGHDSPLLEGDEVNITAYVRVIKDPTGVLWHNFVK
jgi:ubiquitin carboxyl-terminal hydrolase 7